jgi:hypothetical protein
MLCKRYATITTVQLGADTQRLLQKKLGELVGAKIASDHLHQTDCGIDRRWFVAYREEDARLSKD